MRGSTWRVAGPAAACIAASIGCVEASPDEEADRSAFEIIGGSGSGSGHGPPHFECVPVDPLPAPNDDYCDLWDFDGPCGCGGAHDREAVDSCRQDAEQRRCNCALAGRGFWQTVLRCEPRAAGSGSGSGDDSGEECAEDWECAEVGSRPRWTTCDFQGRVVAVTEQDHCLEQNECWFHVDVGNGSWHFIGGRCELVAD